jgi:O-antigen chain-terminating methyltransferase
LSEHNIPVKGIDINEENINICSEFGLNAELADALTYLKSVKNNSLIGITAFQVVEHLNNDYLIELIKVSFQKIKEGGIIVLETANPLSLYSLRNFYIDLTHRNPIPSDTLKFLVEAAGFVNVKVDFSSPVPDEIKLSGNDDNVKKLNDLLFGYQEYAIIANK